MGSKIQGFPYPRKTVRVELPDDVELPASTAEVLGKEPQKAVLVPSVPDTVSISTASAPKTTKVVVEDTAEKTVTQPKVSYKVVTPPEEPQSWWDSRLGTVAKWGIGSAGIGGAFGLLSAAFRQDVAEEAHDHLGWVSHLGLPDIFTGVVFGGILGSLVGIIPALLQSDKNTQPPSYVVETTTSADGVVSTRTLHTPTYGGAVGYGNDDGGYYGGGGAGYYRGRGGGGYPVYYNSGSSDDHFLQNYVTARVVENAVFGGGYGGRGRYYGSGYGDDIHHHHYYYPSSSGSHASSSSSSSTHNHYYGGGSSSSGGGKSRGKGSFFTKSDGSRRSMFGSSKSSRSSGSTHSSGGGGKSRGSGSTGRSSGKK